MDDQSIKEMDDQSIKEMIRRALASDEAAQNWIVRTLTPVIQVRVARKLSGRTGHDTRSEVKDLTQKILLHLFADDGKVLLSWEPERGLSFLNFFGRVAENKTKSYLRSPKQSQSKEDLIPLEDFDQVVTESRPDSERITASRELLRLLLERLEEIWSPRDWHLFDLLYLQELPVAEVAPRTAMTADAIYTWQSRFRRLVRRLVDEMSKRPGE